jgi:hypothetical protein
MILHHNFEVHTKADFAVTPQSLMQLAAPHEPQGDVSGL